MGCFDRSRTAEALRRREAERSGRLRVSASLRFIFPYVPLGMGCFAQFSLEV
jgi:hypothetical protein